MLSLKKQQGASWRLSCLPDRQQGTVLLLDLEKDGFTCFLCLWYFLLFLWPLWTLRRMYFTEIGVNKWGKADLVCYYGSKVNISMPCRHLALHAYPLNVVFYTVAGQVLQCFSPCPHSGGEGASVIDGNIPGLWANNPGGKLEIMTKIFFNMLIQCQTTMLNVLQMVYFESKVEYFLLL